MMATDEFFKVLNYRAHVWRSAVESAEKKGLSFIKNPKESFEHIRDITKGTYDSQPGEMFYGLNKQSMSESHVATFTEPFSKTGEKVYSAIREWPITAFITPFIKQPINNLKDYIRTVPGIAAFSTRVQREIAAGGAREEIMLSQLSVGAGIFTTLSLWVMGEGGSVHGNPKMDPEPKTELRELGIDPYTYRNVDGDQVNYRGLEPIAGKIAIAAAVMDQWMHLINTSTDELSDEEMKDVTERMMMTGLLTTLDTFKDQSALRGFETALKVAEGGTDARTMPVMTQWLSSIITTFSGNIKWYNEKYNQHDRNNPEGLLESMSARYGIDGVKDINLFGDPRPTAKPYGITPVRISKGTDSPVQQEVIRLKEKLPGEMVLTTIPKNVEGVKIDNREKWNLMKLNKHLKDDKGHNLEQGLKEVMKMEMYKRGTDKMKATLLGTYYKARLNAAKIALLYDSTRFKEGKSRSYAKKYELLDYDRSQALANVWSRRKVKEHKRLTGSVPDEYRTVDRFEKSFVKELEGNQEIPAMLKR